MGAKPQVIFKREENHHHQNRQLQQTSCSVSQNRSGSWFFCEHSGHGFLSQRWWHACLSGSFPQRLSPNWETWDIWLVSYIWVQPLCGEVWTRTLAQLSWGVLVFPGVSPSPCLAEKFCLTSPICKWLQHLREASCHFFHSPFSPQRGVLSTSLNGY